jgi:peptidoglycan/LPS O-acetylase OafA/YrhL
VVVNPRADRLPALTGLRFLAAALVVWHHARGFNISVPHVPIGAFGVSTFFVLSGFILAHVHPKLDDRRAVGHFLALRVVRIWPLHLVTLLFAAIVLVGSLGLPFLANLTMTHAWVPLRNYYFSYNSVSWTISTEFFFYLMFPVLIWQWRRTWWWKWFASGSLVAALIFLVRWLDLPDYWAATEGVTTHLVYISPLARLFEFVSGIAAYHAFLWLRPRAEGWRHGAPRAMPLIATGLEFLFLILVVAVLVYSPLVGLFDDRGWHVWLWSSSGLVAIPLLIALAIGAGALSQVLSLSVVVFLGEISYAIYLTHQLIFLTYWQSWGGREGDYAGLALCLALTLIVSALLYRVLEVPCRTFVKKRLAKNSSVYFGASALVPDALPERSRARHSKKS